MSSAWAVIENQGEILMIRRSFDVGRPGQWCPPGGTMWSHERPDVACVREAFEETGLRVSVVRGLAEFDGAHFFICKLHSDREAIQLRERECIDAKWIVPSEILTLGTVMDFKKVYPALEIAGLPMPEVPKNFTPNVPDQLLTMY